MSALRVAFWDGGPPPRRFKSRFAVSASEAAKYNVLPLDNSSLARWNTPRGRTSTITLLSLAG
jgi:hypothetical protein